MELAVFPLFSTDMEVRMIAHRKTTSLCLATSIGALMVWILAPVLDRSIAYCYEDRSKEQVHVRLRITWGGGTAQAWQGHIHFHDATISSPAVLGMNVEL